MTLNTSFNISTQSYSMSNWQLRDAFERAIKNGYGYLVTTTVTEPGGFDDIAIHELPFEIRKGHELEDLRGMYEKHARTYLKQVFDLEQPFDEQIKNGGLQSDKEKMAKMPAAFTSAVETVQKDIEKQEAYAHQPRWQKILGLRPRGMQ